MCCFSVADVFLEDPPPEKKEEKKEEKVKKNYVLVSDQLNLQPIVSYSHFSFLYLVILTSYFHFSSLIPTSSTTLSHLPLQHPQINCRYLHIASIFNWGST